MTTATIAMNPKIRFDCFFVCLTLSYVQCVCVHCNVDCSKYFFIKFLNVVYQSATDCFSLFRPICHFTRAISSWHSLSVGWFVCVFVAPSPYSFTSCCLWILFRALFTHDHWFTIEAVFHDDAMHLLLYSFTFLYIIVVINTYLQFATILTSDNGTPSQQMAVQQVATHTRRRLDNTYYYYTSHNSPIAVRTHKR